MTCFWNLLKIILVSGLYHTSESIDLIFFDTLRCLQQEICVRYVKKKCMLLYRSAVNTSFVKIVCPNGEFTNSLTFTITIHGSSEEKMYTYRDRLWQNDEQKNCQYCCFKTSCSLWMPAIPFVPLACQLFWVILSSNIWCSHLLAGLKESEHVPCVEL